MTSITFSPAAVPASKVIASKVIANTAKRPSFFSRLSQAIMKSRQRKADIEIRRMRAAINEPKSQLDYAMLPFAGE